MCFCKIHSAKFKHLTGRKEHPNHRASTRITAASLATRRRNRSPLVPAIQSSPPCCLAGLRSECLGCPRRWVESVPLQTPIRRHSAEIDRTGRLRLGGSMPRSRIQRRTWFALSSLASAMPATDAPTSQQAAITACLNSSVWFRLRRLGFSISIVSTIVIGGHYLHGLSPQFTDDFAGCLR